MIRLSRPPFQKNQNQAGFTLIEVLVSLFLLAITFGLVIDNVQSDRERLEQSLSEIERALRFAADEVTLRNKILRLHIDMESEENSYSLEVGPDGHFVRPVFSDEGLTASDIEEQEKQKKRVNQKFNTIKEFQGDKGNFPQGVRPVGIFLASSDKLYRDGHPSLYFYPTGEKDGGLIFLGNEQEVVGIAVNPFSFQLERFYQPISENETDLIEAQEAAAVQIVDEWRSAK